MAKGATLVIVPETLATFPPKLVEFLIEKKINWIFWVPTIMVNIANLDLFATYQLPHLRTIWFAGEVFPTKHLNYWRRHLPHAKFVNLYGPIEITLDCTYYVVEKDLPDEMPVPIGFPCRNTDVLILNDDNKSAGINEKGELCVRGTSLAMGYYNDPEKTAKAFVQNPLNPHYPEWIYRTGDIVYKNESGEIIFAGRRDFQVKHLGYRIDLGEIEHVIVNTWGKVRNGCIVYNPHKKEICLFYEGAEEISPAVFRKDLVLYLPKYMIPTDFRFFTELPRNPNGKIDRNLLATIIRDEAVVQ
jgi:acyl-coenzyme A synthetase/AMP-(fatty) acid ligase